MEENSEKGRFHIIRHLLVFYLAWIVPAGALFYFPVHFPVNLIKAAAVMVVPIFLFLAAFIAMRMIIFDARWLTIYGNARTPLFATTVFVWILLFYAERKGLLFNGVAGIVGTANLLVAAGLAGTGMAAVLKRPAELVPVCVVASFADLCSVLRGPTREMAKTVSTYYESGMAGPPPLVDFLLVKVPVPGLFSLMPLFGITDWVLLILLSAAVYKFDMNDQLCGKGIARMAEEPGVSVYFPLSAAGLLLGIVLAHLTGIFIPAMPLMTFVFLPCMLIRYPGAWKMKQSDWLYTLIFPCVILAGTALFT